MRIDEGLGDQSSGRIDLLARRNVQLRTDGGDAPAVDGNGREGPAGIAEPRVANQIVDCRYAFSRSG
jgi:hypothetical protein